jgi:hypothetical protein
MKLGEHQQAADMCASGLAADAGASELQQLQCEARRALQAAAYARQREAAQALAKRAPARRLAATLLAQQYKVGRPQLSVGARCPFTRLYPLPMGREMHGPLHSSNCSPER